MGLILLGAGTVEAGGAAALRSKRSPSRNGSDALARARALSASPWGGRWPPPGENFGILAAGDGVAAARLRETASAVPVLPDAHAAVPALHGRPGPGPRRQPAAAVEAALSASAATARTSGPICRLALLGPAPAPHPAAAARFGPTATHFELSNSRRARESRSGPSTGRQSWPCRSPRLLPVLSSDSCWRWRSRAWKRSEGLRRASEARLEVGLVSKLDVSARRLQASQAEESMVRAEAADDGPSASASCSAFPD